MPAPRLRILAVLLLVLATQSLACNTGSGLRMPGASRPNVILIVADDLGYGDLGCYGQETVRTPNIDRMARAGMRFTQFYAGSTVCAPSRASLMTGLHTGHCGIRGNSRQPLLDEDVTLAEVIGPAGYRTACIGKWGLGELGSEGMPTRQGFDEFYGYLNQRHAHNYYPTFLIRNEERIELDNVVPEEDPSGAGKASEKRQYSHDLITDEAFRFVRESAGEPFFLLLTWTIPHANNEARAEGMEVPELGEYADEDWPDPAKGFAAMVTRMDRDVGRLFDLLDELELTDDTLVLFTSDNGPHSEGGHKSDTFRSSGALRGQKRDLFEGGIRVPLVAHWPGKVPAGSVSEHVGAFWDFMPTLADLTGSGRRVPRDTDGLSFVPALRGHADDQKQHESLYWAFYERGAAQALRSGRWKVVQQPYDSLPRLFDLQSDPGETVDISDRRPEILARLQMLMREAYVPSAEWRFPEKRDGR